MPLFAWVHRCLVRCGLAVALALWLTSASAQSVELAELAHSREDQGLSLTYGLRVHLPRVVEEALQRGLPLHFVAQATVTRPRWYWRDERVARQTRNWRLSYQHLTNTWRVSLGALHQTYASQSEALLAMTRAAGWQVVEPGQLDPGERYWVDFSWRLDTSQLPRPMQIGIGGHVEWTIGIERGLRVEPSP